MTDGSGKDGGDAPRVEFETEPGRYRHWKLGFDGPVATLALDVQEDGGIRDGYKLKLNSYDLGVDIEFHDAVQRIRFEHPEVRTVVITSARERMFCAGANIYMLGTSSHGWKVNFCKFTNETRNGLEDSSADSGLKFLCAINGACAGGGYEIALACDEIVMVDDRSTTVSLPEVPLLGVLPGTGGLTRLTDKRKMRRDLADVFCTSADGVRAERARDWKLVDHIARPAEFAAAVKARATALAATSDRPASAKGIALAPLGKTATASGWRYGSVEVALDRAARIATVTVNAPAGDLPHDVDGIVGQGAAWWPLRVMRELDDAILSLRVNEPQIGLWVLKTSGPADQVLEAGSVLLRHRAHWLVRETIGLWRRTLQRLDVSARSLFAVLDRGSCFAGLLAELAFAADRSYMLDSADADAPALVLDEFSFNGLLATPAARTRLAMRFQDDEAAIAACRARLGQALSAPEAEKLGLVTFAPDELDWDEEIRLALEERASLSPDALSGLEASLRFGGAETMASRIFGRLSAWQNWIFNRPNAVGEKGALKLFGTGSKARFDWERV
ncbi:MAG TPA: 2,3-epoxybenzoyl-CoA dihydrolase [Alphaproteobacteria bacterium]|nr:2,3-epoxybenzoyl-CoA dihydrolase [Alphaproteobacteria bacterium]